MTPLTSIGGGLPQDFRGLVGLRMPDPMEGMIGPGPHLTGRDLAQAIAGDMGLPATQRQGLLQMFNSPNVAEQLLGGVAGGALGLALARFKKLSGPAQVLMSLAGFGLGNIIVNKLTQPGQFTEWNPDGARNRIIL